MTYTLTHTHTDSVWPKSLPQSRHYIFDWAQIWLAYWKILAGTERLVIPARAPSKSLVIWKKTVTQLCRFVKPDKIKQTQWDFSSIYLANKCFWEVLLFSIVATHKAVVTDEVSFIRSETCVRSSSLSRLLLTSSCCCFSSWLYLLFLVRVHKETLWLFSVLYLLNLFIQAEKTPYEESCFC